MNTSTLSILKEIGNQLDNGQFPRVYNSGIIEPENPAVVHQTQGKETRNGRRKRKKRPATRPWERPSRGQGATRGSRNADSLSPLISTKLQRRYERHVAELIRVYPDTEYWDTVMGMWLKVESSLLMGADQKATFLIFLPYVESVRVQAWGFWTTLFTQVWIGPRHTNYPDGSICAFEPSDNTWATGKNLVLLLGLYSLWAVKHLHLELVGQWPGYQAVHHPYERMTEIKDNEYCGCETVSKRYIECCKIIDFSMDISEIKADFRKRYGAARIPPKSVLDYMNGKGPLPSFRYS